MLGPIHFHAAGLVEEHGNQKGIQGPRAAKTTPLGRQQTHGGRLFFGLFRRREGLALHTGAHQGPIAIPQIRGPEALQLLLGAALNRFSQGEADLA